METAKGSHLSPLEPLHRKLKQQRGSHHPSPSFPKQSLRTLTTRIAIPKCGLVSVMDTGVKWEGKARGRVRSGTTEQVWPFVEDFCNLHKWLPTIDTCHRVEGEYGKPGLIRYCAVTHEKKATLWTLERLLTMDPVQRCFSYDIVDNNVGFHSYVATWKLIPMDDGNGCEVEWSAVADPVDGWKYEDFLDFGHTRIRSVAERIDKALQCTSLVV